MAVKKAYNHENELLACRPSPEVMIQIFMPGHATLYSMVSYFYQIHWQLAAIIDIATQAFSNFIKTRLATF